MPSSKWKCVGPCIHFQDLYPSDSFGTLIGHAVSLLYKVSVLLPPIRALDETCVKLPHICMPTLSPLRRLASCMSFGLHVDNVSKVSTGTQSLTSQSCSKQSIITHETVTHAAIASHVQTKQGIAYMMVTLPAWIAQRLESSNMETCVTEKGYSRDARPSVTDLVTYAVLGAS